jgi:molecular chaperone GrpE
MIKKIEFCYTKKVNKITGLCQKSSVRFLYMNENENNNAEQQQQQGAERVDAASAQLQECEAQLNEWKDRCLRTAADFENFKRRTEKEKVLWMGTAQSAILADILEIADDFERALAQPDETESKLRAGIELTYKSLQKLLEKYGVAAMQPTTTFDPNLHEAIMQTKSDQVKSGDIMQVLQKGYMHKGQVLRPAKVSVAE